MLMGPIRLSDTPDIVSDLYTGDHTLVHMLEVPNYGIYKKGFNPDIKTFIPYADSAGSLKFLPCSSIKENFATGLFSEYNRVGIMFDAGEADLLYTAPNMVYNNVLGSKDGRIEILGRSVFPETDALQKFEESGFQEGHTTSGLYRGAACIIVPTDVSPEKNERCLAAITEGWRQMEKVTAREKKDQGDMLYMLLRQNMPMITEALVNINDIKCAKAIIYDSSEAPEYSPNDVEKCRHSNPIHALAFKGFIKKHFNIDLPIIMHRKFPQSTALNEMNFERSKVEEVIKNSYTMPDSLRDNILHAFEPLVGVPAASKISDHVYKTPAGAAQSPGQFERI